MSQKLLHISSSASGPNSVTEKLSQAVLDHLNSQGDFELVHRDLGTSELPLLNPALVGAYFTPDDQRSEEQNQLLEASNQYVQELQDADVILIGAPMYNFGIPAALKAYFDLVARAGLTFSYTKEGPVGHLTGKKAIVTVATGGTPLSSPYDFVTPYIKQFLAFLGISDVHFISIDQRGDFDQHFATAQNNIQAIQL